MIKKYKYIIGALAIVIVVLCISLLKFNRKTRTYIGINGQTITVRGKFPWDNKALNSEEIPQIGTVIKGENGNDEVIYAINEDGSYITIPVEDYEKTRNVDNDKVEEHTEEQVSQPNTGIKVTPAQWSANTKIATNMPILDFADDNILILHDYFGLFIYNLNAGEIEDSIDLQALEGVDFNNDSFCEILVSQNADTIWIRPVSSELLYEYDRISKELTTTNHFTNLNIFQDFVLTKDIPPEKLPVKSYRCSKQSVSFADGSYGSLNIKNERITGISYIRSGKEWVLFSEKNCTLPELLKQDDLFYEQFVEQGSESADSLMFSYCTMVDYGEYAGICALSRSMEYSDEMQKEWNALQLTTSGVEIKTTADRACFKINIISSDASSNSSLLKGSNEKYLYLKKEDNGWYADGFWQETEPPEY